MLCIFFHIFKALFLYTTESYFCVCSDKGNIFFLSFFDSEDFKYITYIFYKMFYYFQLLGNKFSILLLLLMFIHVFSFLLLFFPYYGSLIP